MESGLCVLCTFLRVLYMYVRVLYSMYSPFYLSWTKQMSGMERGRIMIRAACLIRDNLEEFARAETLDNGKPIWESRLDHMRRALKNKKYNYDGVTIQSKVFQAFGSWIPLNGR